MHGLTPSLSTPDFLADSTYPHETELTVATPAGFKIYTTTDQPNVPVPNREDEVKNVTEVRDIMEARNFLLVKVGDKDWQVIAQGDWSYKNVATGEKSKMSGGTFPTKISWSKESKPDPLFKSTKPGKIPTNKPLLPPRDSHAAVNYLRSKANWTIVNDTAMAQKYRALQGDRP